MDTNIKRDLPENFLTDEVIRDSHLLNRHLCDILPCLGVLSAVVAESSAGIAASQTHFPGGRFLHLRVGTLHWAAL